MDRITRRLLLANTVFAVTLVAGIIYLILALGSLRVSPPDYYVQMLDQKATFSETQSLVRSQVQVLCNSFNSARTLVLMALALLTLNLAAILFIRNGLKKLNTRQQ
jgi:hypothetical protein